MPVPFCLFFSLSSMIRHVERQHTGSLINKNVLFISKMVIAHLATIQTTQQLLTGLKMCFWD